MGFMDFFKRKSSGDVAKDRLKLLLVSDRANCSPDVMELIKNDIIKVISKYMEIDAEGLDIQITQTESDTGNGTVPEKAYGTAAKGSWTEVLPEHFVRVDAMECSAHQRSRL